MRRRANAEDLARRKDEVAQAIEDLTRRLVQIADQLDRDGSYEYILQLYNRWEEAARSRIEELLGTREARRFADAKGFAGWGMYSENLKADGVAKLGYFGALRDVLKQDPSSILKPRDPKPVSKNTKAKTNTAPSPSKGTPAGRPRVFIIHGHDATNRLQLEKLLDKEFNLEPVILLEEPGKGRFNMEKFEEVAPICVFAFALLTPDDLVKVKDVDGHTSTYTQARPNVIYELGWFHAKLGRRGACILIKGDPRLHSDLDGIAVIRFKDHVQEKFVEIKRELAAVGLA